VREGPLTREMCLEGHWQRSAPRPIAQQGGRPRGCIVNARVLENAI